MKTATLAVFMAVTGICQTAKVVQLSDQDVKQVQTARAALDKAQAAWDTLRSDIEHRYVSDAQEVTNLVTSGSGLALDSHGYVYLDAYGNVTRRSISSSDANQEEAIACARIAYGIPEQKDIDLCRKLLDLRAKSKAEQDAEDAKEKERLAKLPKTITYTRRPGWMNGFEFSEDLRFLVPKAPQPAADCSITPGGYLRLQ